MLYIGYFIIVNGQKEKNSVLEISIFELQRLHKQVVAQPPPHPLDPPPQHPNRVEII